MVSGPTVPTRSCPLDEEISERIKEYMLLGSHERNEICRLVMPKHSDGFFAYSERMASFGLRENSEEPLFLGLVALALEGFKFDLRESLMVLSLHAYSAKEIGVDVITLFSRAAEFGDTKTKEVFVNFARKPTDIKAMGYKLSTNSSGPRYERA